MEKDEKIIQLFKTNEGGDWALTNFGNIFRIIYKSKESSATGVIYFGDEIEFIKIEIC